MNNFLMNKDTKIFNKLLANQIKQHIKMIMHHDQAVFILCMQVWFKIFKAINIIQYLNRTQCTNYMVTALAAEKTFDKIQHPLMIKNGSSCHIRNRGNTSRQ
jgi:ABC-type uncharacterized transport system permease subunit